MQMNGRDFANQTRKSQSERVISWLKNCITVKMISSAPFKEDMGELGCNFKPLNIGCYWRIGPDVFVQSRRRVREVLIQFKNLI